MGPSRRMDAVSKEPGARSETWMAVLATALLVVGAALGLGILALEGASEWVVKLTAAQVLRMVVFTTLVTGATLTLHEALHGLGMVVVGARPRFGAGVMSPGLPYLYTTSDGHLFTRLQYLVIAAAPNLLINLGLLWLIAFGPHATWFVVPFAVHLSGGIGDAWLCWATLVERPGTLVEDQRAGIRVYRPGRG